MEAERYIILAGSIQAFFSNSDYLYIGFLIMAVLVLISIVLLIVQTVKMSKLKKRLNKFLLGKDGTSLEQDIIGIAEDNKFLKTMVGNNQKDIQSLYKKMESTYQKMGLVRYDAFNQMGGQLSFCLSLLDENNNGFLLNSVHSAEGCYCYTKEIKEGEYNNANGTLSPEEEESLNVAKSL